MNSLIDEIELSLADWGRDVLRIIGKRMKKIGKSSERKALRVYASAEADEILRVAQNNLNKVVRRNIVWSNEISKETCLAAYNKMLNLYAYRGIKSALNSKSFANEFALKAAVEMLNLAQTRVMCIYDPVGRRVISLRSAMIEAFDKAAASVVNGEDLTTNIRRVTKMFGGSGLRVQYPGTTRRLDSVVRQNVLYQSKQAAQAYSYQLGAELNCDGIEIDWHYDSRPSHEFMQGRQFALHEDQDVDGKIFPGAETTRDKGTNVNVYDALNDYGCRHFATPIILGVSAPTYSKNKLLELNKSQQKIFDINGKKKTRYEWTQKMRRLEAETRRQKDIQAIAEGSGDLELARSCEQKIKLYRQQYEKISEVTKIKEDLGRMISYN